MATAAQLKALINSHYQNDYDRFDTISLQLASHEAKVGHTSLALDIKKIVDNSKGKRIDRNLNEKNIHFQNNSVDELLLYSRPDEKLNELILTNDRKEKIEKIINEYHHQDKLKKHGLENRRKILLSGKPGTGKTMTASVLASELGLPLYIIQIDKIITKFMGETSAKLRQIFKLIESQRGVYFFDEFDSIGTDRSLENEVGEMRRVLNSFLQFLEGDASNSLIITATNNISLLDRALFRRFDDIIYYDLPHKNEIIELFKNNLKIFDVRFKYESIVEIALGLSHADIVRLSRDAIKDAIIKDQKTITKDQLLKCINNITQSYGGINNINARKTETTDYK